MAYHNYMTEVSHLLGANESHAAEELWEVVLFERKLAEISVPEVTRIDTSAIYHKITIQELVELVPQINWNSYFRELVSPMHINGRVCHSILTRRLTKGQRKPPSKSAFPESLWWVLKVYWSIIIFEIFLALK